MPDFKLVVWNMEWMNDLFGPNTEPPAFRADDEVPIHHPRATVRQRRNDLAGVLGELAPEIVVVVEGPNRSDELQLFFDEDVEGEWSTVVQYSKGQSQNLGLAVRRDGGKFADPPFDYTDTNNVGAFDPFAVDTMTTKSWSSTDSNGGRCTWRSVRRSAVGFVSSACT